jgi:hypothetical protein
MAKKIHKCLSCRKEIAQKNELAINRKMLGREIKQFYCFGCLAEYFEVTEEELLEKIEEFKLQGCELFE